MIEPLADYSNHASVDTKRSLPKYWSWLVGGGALLLVLIICFSWLWFKKITVDHLIELVPIDSIFYLTVRDSVIPGEAGIKDVPVVSLFPDFNLLVAQATRVSYVLIADTAGKLQPIYFFQIKNITKAENVISQFDYRYQSGNYLVVATNQEMIDKVVEVQAGKTFSLATVTNSNFSNQRVSFIFSNRNLKNYLATRDELHYRLLAGLIVEDIVGTLNQKGDQWTFEIKNIIGGSTTAPIVNSLPPDFKIFFSGLNLFEIFKAWGEMDQNINTAFAQTANGLSLIYNFDVTGSLVNLINRPIDVIFFDQTVNNVFGFDYVMVFDSANEIEQSALKKLITIVLAQKLPQEISRVLPDQSTVIELKANPEYWQWQSKEIKNSITVEYLAEPRINFNFALAAVNGRLFVSNSSERLERFLSGEQIAMSTLVSCGVDTLRGSKIILNRGQKLFDYTLNQSVVISQLANQTMVGCFGG